MSKSVPAFLLVFFLLSGSTVCAGQLTILTEDSPPVNFIGPSGELEGLSVDIVRKIMERLGIKTQIRVLPWARAYKIVSGRPDTMLFSTTRTSQREHLFKWAGPLAKHEWVFIAGKKSGISIASLEDAKAVPLIGTYRKDARKQYLEANGFTNLHSVTQMSQLLKMLDMDRLDLVAISKLGYGNQHRKTPIPWERFKIVHTFKQVELYMAFSRGTRDGIVRQWQQAFDALKEEGFIDAVNAKWLN